MPVNVYNGPPRPPKPNPNITYVTTQVERDDAYPSLVCRRKKLDVSVFVKDSWILEGQDREGGFIIALRNLYKTMDFPEIKILALAEESGEMKVDKEFIHAPRQLIGLPEFGPRVHIRDEKTLKVATRTADEQPKKRLHTHQAYFNHFEKLTKAKGPRELCEVLEDAIHGLLNVFRMGYVHREIQPEHVVMTRGNDLNRFGFMLSKDGKSVEMPPRFFKGFVYDFTVCKNINGDDDQYDGDTEAIEIRGVTPTSLVKVEKLSEYNPSPIYDLESFLWLLLVTASEIVCDYMAGIRKVKLDDPNYLEAQAEKKKRAAETKLSDECPALDSLTITPNQGDEEPGEDDEKSTEVAMVIAAGDAANAQGESQETGGAEIPMDVDSKEETIEQDKTGDEEVKMGENGNGSRSEDDEEKKRKRDTDTDSEERRKAKGKQRASVETDEEDESSDDEMALHPAIWYYKKLSPYMMISVIKPFVFEPPAGFKPPAKPQYVAFAEDRMAHVVYMLLTPTEIGAKLTFPHFRLHLLQKLDYFISNSVGLRPFLPLIMRLRALTYHYYVRREQIPHIVFSREDVEIAFERYLSAFKEFMPQEEDWNYLKEYEGSDVLYKFDHDQFLGAFASPKNYKPA